MVEALSLTRWKCIAQVTSRVEERQEDARVCPQPPRTVNRDPSLPAEIMRLQRAVQVTCPLRTHTTHGDSRPQFYPGLVIFRTLKLPITMNTTEYGIRQSTEIDKRNFSLPASLNKRNLLQGKQFLGGPHG